MDNLRPLYYNGVGHVWFQTVCTENVTLYPFNLGSTKLNNILWLT